jgi:NAD(P)-dependent dehydrogenase (short-subunit alcohol dehydrogenase family)
MTWTSADIGDLTGRRVLLTGVTGGLGHHTALELARHGAALVVTARDAAKAEATVADLRRQVPAVSVETVALDLADLADVRRAAQDVLDRFDRVDVLIDNAGIMIPPFRRTADGFELQMGTNHLGHFAWAARLWPLLRASSARVVTVSSLAHTRARTLDLRVLSRGGTPRPYRRWRAYAESKLANLSFALELDRRVKAAGLDVVSVAAHPGIASTNLTRTGLGMGRSRLVTAGVHQVSRLVSQSAEAGAWPLLMAATDPTLVGGEYLGPLGPGQTRGRPGPVGSTRLARDPELARQLWAASERATGLTFDVAG